MIYINISQIQIYYMYSIHVRIYVHRYMFNYAIPFFNQSTLIFHSPPRLLENDFVGDLAGKGFQVDGPRQRERLIIFHQPPNPSNALGHFG